MCSRGRRRSQSRCRPCRVRGCRLSRQSQDLRTIGRRQLLLRSVCPALGRAWWCLQGLPRWQVCNPMSRCCVPSVDGGLPRAFEAVKAYISVLECRSLTGRPAPLGLSAVIWTLFHTSPDLPISCVAAGDHGGLSSFARSGGYDTGASSPDRNLWAHGAPVMGPIWTKESWMG